MERETLRVEFVTPCFLGGASQGAEWRAASIRGELRWWFRAVAGAERSLEEVRKAEEVIFGSTERQARLQVRALEGPAPTDLPFGRERMAEWLAEAWGDPSLETQSRLTIKGKRGELGSNPIHYLGFGPVSKGEISRCYLPPGEEAKIELRWGPGKLDNGLKGMFRRALWAWLNLGGIGAKSRKGFGSLRLLDVRRGGAKAVEDPDLSPGNREALAEQAGALLRSTRGQRGGELRWTHVSENTRVFLAAQEYAIWEEAMEQLGAWLIGFRRRYGHRNDQRPGVAGRDYEWAAPNGTDPKGGFPDRAGFGLPLPFTRNVINPATNRKEPKGETVIWGTADRNRREDQEREKESRRASPLLLHVNRFGDGSYLPVLTWMPSEFLPDNALLKFKRDLKSSSPVMDEQRDIVPRFLEDLVGKGRIVEVLP